ncbi:aminopeptidase P family protein [Mesomycoplasma neurolyticum]|uniref:Xaa-Pro aminopeptidase n=1 Tax=Mesomycoplasma neurolyticum TaxID=2120 RepID=A0A449A4T3_9BACT|nr:aminopeptidase P family protein [Mesomycoplasma neurolyticum]VEU59255.1 Xaa-Pro aminopeptidase [Mesomycoplasma neurolyticum]
MNTKYLNEYFLSEKIDVIISFTAQTRLWLTTVQSSEGMVVIEKDKKYLFVDSRYIEYARKQTKNAELILLTAKNLKEFFQSKNYQVIGIEEDYITLGELNKIKTYFPNAKYKPILGQKLRILKTDEEIKNLQKAIDISLLALDKLIPTLEEGQTEREIDHKLNYFMKQLGAQKECFDTIVASGPNSSLPHHKPTERKIKKGELLTIDFGAIYNGYGADITRTFIFGSKANDSKYQEILTIVEEAAAIGRKLVKPGISTFEVDKACRDYITTKGYGQYFVHSTGHGLGIDVHELPSVSSQQPGTILEPGMVITVEPGIYIEGLGGARIEDDLLVTETGSITLSRKNEINGIKK